MPISIKLKKPLLLGIAALCGLALVIQFIPYGRSHANSAVVKEPPWDSVQTRRLAKRACFDCHSYETQWPAYSSIAPASWMIASDVEQGREELNFSDWRGGNRDGEKPGAVKNEIEEGDMPPLTYRLAHVEARLSPVEKRQLSEGWERTLVGR
jgi:hypothetical protein